MPVNLEELLAQPAPEYVSDYPGYEIIYPLPIASAFKTVNAAVFYALSQLRPTQRVDRDEVDGGVVYYFRFERAVYQLFVLHISDTAACLRIHRCDLLNEALLYRNIAWQPGDPDSKVCFGLPALMGRINEAITESLRYAMKMDERTIPPPPPPASELYSVFVWQQIYHPTMPDKELADLIGVSHQTLRNARSRYKQGKRASHKTVGEARVSRGKQKQ